MSRRLALACLSVLAVVISGLVFVSPAEARTTILCRGLTSCAKAGYSSSGYSSVYKQSFWRAVPGHNCTNYVSFRLTHNGRSTSLPEGMASAWRWGIAARENRIPVSQSPKVGDVAWWDLTTNVGAGTGGHVAYVERVYSDGSIRVSEDNYGGDFDWRRLTKSDAWPSGFIRYPKADGSPSGRTISASVTDKTAGAVTVSGYTTEADNYVSSDIELTFSGGDLTSPVTSPAPRTGQWKATRTFGGRMPAQVQVTVRNTPGTPGKDISYGTKVITRTPYVAPPARYSSKVYGSFSDSTIRKKYNPRYRVTVSRMDPSQPYPTGKIYVMEGTRVIKSLTMYSSWKGRLSTTLPKQSRRTHHITVKYVANAPSLSSVSGSKPLVIRK